MNRQEYLKQVQKRKELATRVDKIEEIMEVWASPKFKTNNERLTHLLRHCKSPNHGYTIREFANALHPYRMTGPYVEEDGKYYAFRAIRKMFNRYRNDVENHEVVLFAVQIKGIWYYYNMIDDSKAFEGVQLRLAKVGLGLTKADEHNLDVLEIPQEQRDKMIQEYVTSLEEKQKQKQNNKKAKSKDKVQK